MFAEKHKNDIFTLPQHIVSVKKFLPPKNKSLLVGRKAKALRTDRRTDGLTDGPTDGQALL